VTVKAVSAEMAIRLDKAFGGGAETWLRLQAVYDLAQPQKHPREDKSPACCVSVTTFPALQMWTDLSIPPLCWFRREYAGSSAETTICWAFYNDIPEICL
jgi:hypothetical protein